MCHSHQPWRCEQGTSHAVYVVWWGELHSAWAAHRPIGGLPKTPGQISWCNFHFPLMPSKSFGCYSPSCFPSPSHGAYLSIQDGARKKRASLAAFCTAGYVEWSLTYFHIPLWENLWVERFFLALSCAVWGSVDTGKVKMFLLLSLQCANLGIYYFSNTVLEHLCCSPWLQQWHSCP